MNLIFFQNCLSPHQIPFIRECAMDERVNKVYFVMPRIDYEERSDMGWSNDKLMDEPTIEFVLKPTDDKVRELLDVGNEDVRCLFSGIRADVDVFRWLNISIAFDVKRYIITEPPYTFDKPLWMHYVRFFLQDYKYVKHIDGVFAIGESCERYYRSISKRWKVFPFIYVTEGFDVKPVLLHDDMKVLYVGSLSERKNVKVLVEAMKGLHNVPTHSENFGLAIAESLASGTPVITTVGTPWSDLNGSEAGAWIEIGTEPLVETLRRFLGLSEDELETMGRNGRKLIETKYSAHVMAEQMMEVYKGL